MRRWAGLLLAVCLGLVLPGCAMKSRSTVGVTATRRQPPLIRLEGQPLSVGILLVHAEDKLLDTVRSDLWNVSGLVVKAVRDYFQAAGGQVQVVDYTDLGFEMWTRPRTKAEPSRELGATLEPWPGVPLGVKTSLVTVVKVVEWRMAASTPQGNEGERAVIGMLLSTWTREGQPVRTEYFQVTGDTGGGVVFRSKEAAVALYEELRGSRPPLPEDWTEMFWELLREAVGLHYFPLLAHEAPERLVLVDGGDDAGVRALREGQLARALEVWSQRSAADPRDHAALYNAGLAYSLQGENRQALRLLARARAVEDSPLYQAAWKRVLRRVARMQVVGAVETPADVSRRPPREASAPEQCFFAVQEPNQDPRWTQGLSLDIEEALLADYHPEQCDRPGVRCTIDYYQIQWFRGFWSERLRPGLNDLDDKLNYDGMRRRRWALFFDHNHRYRYCAR